MQKARTSGIICTCVLPCCVLWLPVPASPRPPAVVLWRLTRRYLNTSDGSGRPSAWQQQQTQQQQQQQQQQQEGCHRQCAAE
jgi:hypothetical protein